MGGKDSKPACISYEDAVKRVTDAELRRLKDAFKRSSTLNGFMSRQVFVKEVLGEAVPARLAEKLFLTFGGTQKGLGFKELLSGLVVLTKGGIEERIKFLFGVYSSDESYGYICQPEMDDLVLQTEGHVPDELADLFLESDRVSYEKFREWIGQHSDCLSMTRWLLKEFHLPPVTTDLDTPTFYQTLAGVTHLEESDIIELEKQYWQLKACSKSGRFDLETFTSIVSPPVPLSVCPGLFGAFDENQDNHIDLKELACGVSACGLGPEVERQKFCFKVFDADHDGILSDEELSHMVKIMLCVHAENNPSGVPGGRNSTPALSTNEPDPKEIERIIGEMRSCDLMRGSAPVAPGGGVTMDEYLVWSVNQSLSADLLSLLAQVCHIVLGLRPQSKEDEKSIVIPWLAREEHRGLRAGQVWYLVSMAWWKQWLDYINITPTQTLYTTDPTRLSLGHSSHSPSSSSSVASITTKLSTGHSRASSISLCPGGGVLRRNSSACSSPDDGISLTSFTSLQTDQQPLPKTYVGGQYVRETDSVGQASTSNSQTSSPSGSPSLSRRVIGGAVKPGAIDNTSLVAPITYRVVTLTNEGGCLRRDRPLLRGRDYEIIPEAVWKAMSSWYGRGPVALPRTVIIPRPGASPELELYPIQVRLLRYQLNPTNTRPAGGNALSSSIGGIGGAIYSSLGVAGITSGSGGQPSPPKRYVAHTSVFSRKHSLAQIYDFLTARLKISREDMRLWKIGGTTDEGSMNLLDEDSETKTVEELCIEDGCQLLIEVRNRDLTWPEELCQLAKNKALMDKTATERGATGLSNLGNTCFMNSALQCMSNTFPLTVYFNSGLHLYEINRSNPLGTQGDIAQRYGDLVRDLWSGTARSIAPLKLRWTIGKHAPCFSGFQQHDSQELLAFVLDRLHEDLNRVHDKPYVELKDSDGRPDDLVAQEAWDNHLVRNQSIVVELFHGQLKSCVRCNECQHTSVTFDPFTFLSLPLPMESCIHLEIIVVRLDESCPVKYGLRLSVDERYKGVKAELSKLCSIPPAQLLLVDVLGPLVRSFPSDNSKIRLQQGGTLFVYELPPPSPITPMSAAEERGLSNSSRPDTSPANHCQAANSLTNQNPVKDAIPNGHAGGAEHQKVGEGMGNASTNHVSPFHHRVPGGLGEIQRSHAKQSSSTTSINEQGDFLSPNDVRVNRVGLTQSPLSGNCLDSTEGAGGGFVVAVHRKMVHMDIYFLASHKCRPSLFGTPMILSCDGTTTHQNLYQQVWSLVARLVSPLPPVDHSALNHAQDCDDSLGYEYPFTLKTVQSDGLTCTHCPWYRFRFQILGLKGLTLVFCYTDDFNPIWTVGTKKTQYTQFCKGCKIECSPTLLFNCATSYIAVDWDPTALHLRYHASQEKVYVEHVSVEASRAEHKESIGLDGCLKAFTKEEHLGEEELYYCSKCKEHRQAVKKLELWRLPPILIIHLKRFQFHNGRWVKSQKVVKFPIKDFDPSNYLVRRDLAHNSSNITKTSTSKSKSDTKLESESNRGEENCANPSQNGDNTIVKDSSNLLNGDCSTEILKTVGKHSGNCNNVENTNSDRELENEMRERRDDNVLIVTESKEEEKCLDNEENDEDCKSCAAIQGDSCNGDQGDMGSSVNGKQVNSGSSDVQKEKGGTEEKSSDDHDIRYNLYAVSCHMGILGGGHYITYAKNPNGKWYCYNDSSCKEVSEEQVDTDCAYMLFYEREGLDRSVFMPDVTGKDPQSLDSNDEELDKELKKFCVVQ